LKRPSATKRSPPPPDPTYFTDRDLGKIVPGLLRESGLVVERYCDHFSERNVADNEWLVYVARQGWVAISHDDNIRRDDEAVRAVMENGGRLFIIRGALTAPELAAAFLQSLPSVRSVLRKSSDPFIAAVRRTSLPHGTLRSEAHLVLTREQWRAKRGSG
jgi:PIN domain-containing protein